MITKTNYTVACPPEDCLESSHWGVLLVILSHPFRSPCMDTWRPQRDTISHLTVSHPLQPLMIHVSNSLLSAGYYSSSRIFSYLLIQQFTQDFTLQCNSNLLYSDQLGLRHVHFHVSEARPLSVCIHPTPYFGSHHCLSSERSESNGTATCEKVWAVRWSLCPQLTAANWTFQSNF